MTKKTHGWVRVPLVGSGEEFETEFTEKMEELCKYLDDGWKVAHDSVTAYYIVYLLRK